MPEKVDLLSQTYYKRVMTETVFTDYSPGDPHLNLDIARMRQRQIAEKSAKASFESTETLPEASRVSPTDAELSHAARAARLALSGAMVGLSINFTDRETHGE